MFDWLALLSEYHVALALLILGLPIMLLFGWSTIRAKAEARHRERILDTRTWDRIIAGLQPGWADRYFGAISASTGWFDRVYGPRLLGWRAFDRAFSFALTYAVLTLLIGWVVFDAGNLGGVAFLPEGQPIWQRTAALCTLACAGGMLIVVTYFWDVILAWMTTKIQMWPKGKSQPKNWARLSTTILGPIVFSTFFLAVSGFVVASAFFVGVRTSGLAVAFGFSGFIALAVADYLVFAILLMIPTACGFVLIPALRQEVSFPYFFFDFRNLSDSTVLFNTTFLMFLFMIPFLNAIADFLSVAATRHFLRRIAARKIGVWGVLAGLALDILIAVLCLTLLLVLMTQTLDLWARTAAIPLPFDWRSYRDTICGGDWQRGTMLWLMLITTLAPTALHLAVGLGAVFSHSAQVDRQIAAILTPARDALKSTHARVKEKGDGARARLVLDPDAVHRLEDFLARKEVWARVTAITLFGLFMAALIYFVFELAQRFALPQLGPAP